MSFDQREPRPSDLSRQRKCHSVIVRLCRISSQSFRFNARLNLPPEVDLIGRIQSPRDARSIWPRTEIAVDVNEAIDIGKQIRGFASLKSSGGA